MAKHGGHNAKFSTSTRKANVPASWDVVDVARGLALLEALLREARAGVEASRARTGGKLSSGRVLPLAEFVARCEAAFPESAKGVQVRGEGIV